MDLPIEAIDVGERSRTDLGDIDELAASIAAIGLLHPVVVTNDHALVAGERRLEAVRSLGWRRVPVTVVGLDDAADVLRAELEENTCRKPLTPYEADVLREKRERVLAPKAARNKGGRPKSGETTGSNLEQVSQNVTKTRKAAAIGTGYSGSTLDKVRVIRDVAERGLIRRSGVEMPAPEKVVTVARERLEGVKQTGAAVDSASKAVHAAVERYLDDDQDIRDSRYRHEVTKAIGAAGRLLEFEPQRVAEVLHDLSSVHALRDGLTRWFAAVDKAAQPTRPKVVTLNRKAR